MLDTYQTIYNKLQLRAPAISSLLARDWVTDAFRQIAVRRRWSWKYKYGEFIFPNITNTGTVTCVQNYNVITGSGTSWNQTLVGQQFRVGVVSPIYTIVSVNSSTSLTIDLPWGAGNLSNTSYQIYLAYATPPEDFQSLVTVWDPNYNWQLYLNVQQQEINAFDAQRANTGPASYLVSARDYSSVYQGIIGAVTSAFSTGASPVSTSQGSGYVGVNSVVYNIQVTGTGISGVATFKWNVSGGSSTTGVVTSDTPQDLNNGVQVYWPDGVTYNSGDTFTISCQAVINGGLPRYEFWPHKQSQYVFPFLYEQIPPDLGDPGATLPRYIRGDVLLEMSLEQAAQWTGLQDKPNPYFNLNLAQRHHDKAEQMIYELERQDDETSEMDAKYELYTNLPFAPWPFGDSSWIQSHAI